jgi:hypothetical protein
MNELYKFYNIDKGAFEALEPVYKVITSPNARRYALVKINNKGYGVSWASDGIEPKIIYIKNYNILLIGIDTSVIAISLETLEVKFCIGLTEWFCFFVEIELGFVVVSETTIIIVNGENCSISQFKGMPDLITDCRVEGNKLIINCLETSSESEIYLDIIN